MDESRFLTREHIEARRGDARPEVVEQAARSLALVAALARTGLDFRFKGGNSLLLILQELRRFSIDVDVATGEPRERIESCLEAAVRESSAFTRVARRQHKTKPWLPLASFEVYYRSALPGLGETFIFFDAQLKRTAYAGQRVQVRCGTLFASDQTVEVATPGGILGDKLLTLGPETYGIPLGRNKEAQRLKHAFDVGRLARAGPQLSEIRDSVNYCMEQEAELQGRAIPIGEVLLDTLAFCACPVPFSGPPPVEGAAPLMAEIVRGLEPFRGHLLSGGYGWGDLQVDLGAAAVCISAAASAGVREEEFASALRAADSSAMWRAVERWTGFRPGAARPITR